MKAYGDLLLHEPMENDHRLRADRLADQHHVLAGSTLQAGTVLGNRKHYRFGTLMYLESPGNGSPKTASNDHMGLRHGSFGMLHLFDASRVLGFCNIMHLGSSLKLGPFLGPQQHPGHLLAVSICRLRTILKPFSVNT